MGVEEAPFGGRVVEQPGERDEPGPGQQLGEPVHRPAVGGRHLVVEADRLRSRRSRRTRPGAGPLVPGPAPARRAARAIPRAGYGSSSSGPARRRARRPRPAGPPSAPRRTAASGWARRAWSTMAGERSSPKASSPKSCSMAVRCPGPHPTSAARRFPVPRTSSAKVPIMARANGRVSSRSANIDAYSSTIPS